MIAKGRSALGEALNLLCKKVNSEVRKTTLEVKGDWKPLLFILSDGGYSGPIAKPLSEFKKLKFGLVVACAAGSKAKVDVLKKITQNVNVAFVPLHFVVLPLMKLMCVKDTT